MIEAKNILIVFSSFSHVFLKHLFLDFLIRTATHFKIGFETWGVLKQFLFTNLLKHKIIILVFTSV